MNCPCGIPFPEGGGKCDGCGWAVQLLDSAKAAERDRELAQRLAPYLADALYEEFTRRALRQGAKLFSGTIRT